MDAAAVKQECQKFYDLLHQPPSQGSTIEFLMRTLDQDTFHPTQNCITSAPPPSSSSNTMVNGMNSMSRASQQQQLNNNNNQQQQGGVELDPNVVLQNLGLNTEEDDGSSNANGERPYVCQVCLASYKTRTHLRRHMFVHLNNRPYPCECGKGFNRKEHLNKHIEAVHSGTKHKCQFCQKEISRKDHLSRHIKNMHPAFSNSFNKDMSIQQDQSVLKVQLPCGQKQKVAQLSFLTPTFPSTTTTVGQTIITPISNISGKSKMSKLQQIHTLQNTSNQQEQHAQAQLIMDSPYQQVAQLTLLPGIVIPGQITNSVGGSSSQQKGAKVHNHNVSLNNHNGLLGLTNLSLTLGGQIREAPFANCGENKKMMLQVFNCTECSATFASEKDFNAHARSHKPQNFRCTDCPRAYTRREKLTEHIRCFHQGQKFKCEHCGKELSRKDHVLRHVRSIHPEVLASRFTAELQESGELGNDRLNSLSGSNGTSSAINEMGVLLRSVCHICLKVFGTSYHLSRHMESCHNGDIRPYSCLSCSKQFKRKDHLTKHIKSHCPSIRDANQMRTKLPPSMNKTLKAENRAVQIRIEDDRKNKLKEMKLEITSMGDGSEEDENEDENEKTDAKVEDSDFNLAMINSFIAENVNVVVEEEDLSSLLHPEQPSNSSISTTVDGENGSVKLNEDNESANSFASHSQMTTFPCGHCQKEFKEKDQLLDHLQDHTNDDITQPEENEPHQRLTSLQFSNY